MGIAEIAEQRNDAKTQRAALGNAYHYAPSQPDSLRDLVGLAKQEKRTADELDLLKKLVVMDPHTGEILALASYPTFNPNAVSDYRAASRVDRAIQAVYEPGSTFKIVTASAGLEEGVVTPSQVLDCGDGFIQIGNTQIHEHGHNRYGLMTFEDGMRPSSNVRAIRVALPPRPAPFYHHIRRPLCRAGPRHPSPAAPPRFPPFPPPFLLPLPSFFFPYSIFH